jgi:hypothetical protein
MANGKGQIAFSRQHSAFSPRNCFVVFQLASFPARLQKSKEASQPYHRLRFNRIEQHLTLMQGKSEGKPKRKTNPSRNGTDFKA